jgi:hypothetical protein
MIEIMDLTHGTRIFGNRLREISRNESGDQAVIRIHSNSSRLRVSNNIIQSTTAYDNDLYATWIDATGSVESRLANNTIYNIDRGLLLEDHGAANQFGIYNNILDVNDLYFESIGNQGTFNLSHNLYFSAPVAYSGMPYYEEEGRQVGPVDFENAESGDFRLKISSEKAVGNGLSLTPPVLVDFGGNSRSVMLPDIGALELEHKSTWLGSHDQNWHDPLNWDPVAVPGTVSNIVITTSPVEPAISIGDAHAGGVLLKTGAHLIISGDKQLIIGN